MTEILDTCRIFRDIDKHPLPGKSCRVDVKLSCGSVLIDCEYNRSYIFPVVFIDLINIPTKSITQWRLSK